MNSNFNVMLSTRPGKNKLASQNSKLMASADEDDEIPEDKPANEASFSSTLPKIALESGVKGFQWRDFFEVAELDAGVKETSKTAAKATEESKVSPETEEDDGGSDSEPSDDNFTLAELGSRFRGLFEGISGTQSGIDNPFEDAVSDDQSLNQETLDQADATITASAQKPTEPKEADEEESKCDSTPSQQDMHLKPSSLKTPGNQSKFLLHLKTVSKRNSGQRVVNRLHPAQPSLADPPEPRPTRTRAETNWRKNQVYKLITDGMNAHSALQHPQNTVPDLLIMSAGPPSGTKDTQRQLNPLPRPLPASPQN